ncbi:hypothetical protein Tco_1190447, partial [Tanacetum coccineum]
RKIADLDVNAEVALTDETQGRNNEDFMFDNSILEEPMVSATTTTSSIPVSDADLITTVGEVVTTASIEILDELTLAQTLIEIKSTKPKAVTTTGTTISSILVSTVDPITTAGEVVTTASIEIPNELTLAQTLIEIKKHKTQGCYNYCYNYYTFQHKA